MAILIKVRIEMARRYENAGSCQRSSFEVKEEMKSTGVCSEDTWSGEAQVGRGEVAWWGRSKIRSQCSYCSCCLDVTAWRGGNELSVIGLWSHEGEQARGSVFAT